MRNLEGKISSNIFFQASLAEMMIAAEQFSEAQILLTQQLTLYPDNFPLAMMHTKALLADKQYNAAETVLQTQSKLRPTDTHIWFLLAETAGLASNITRVHLARVEYFYRQALEQVGGDKLKVDESQFRYPGPKPNTKETGILMICEAIEAADAKQPECDRGLTVGLVT